MKRVGLLTGGGDCPGLNAVIRAVVKSAVGHYGWEVIGIEDGYDGLVGEPRFRPLTPADVQGILPRGGTILGTSNRGNPFAVPIRRPDGTVFYEDRSDQVIENIDRLQLDALITIGGDGTLKIGLELIEKGVPIIGVPKTIDNDIAGTDVSFGFDTAVETATDAIDRLHTTAESHHRVMVLEVMGRHAGWIGLHAGLAGGADVILIPEIPFDLNRVAEKVAVRERAGRRFSIVVVAEGARPVGGEPVFIEPPGEGRYGRLGGIGNRVGAGLAAMTGKETRVTILGHVQRGGSPTAFDRVLATRFGAEAVRMVERGEFGKMVALRGQDLTAVDIADAVRVPKLVDPDGELVRTAEEIGISFGR